MSKTMQKNSKNMGARDVITLGVFTALYFVFYMVGGVFFAANPALTFYMPMGSALVCGPIFMVIVAKVGKRFAISTLGILMGLALLLTGMHWAFTLSMIVMGIVADFVSGMKNYKSKGVNILAYAVFSLGNTGSYIVYFANQEEWIATMLENAGTEYIEGMVAATYSWTLPVILIGTVLVATLSAYLGSKMLKNQIEKAGII